MTYATSIDAGQPVYTQANRRLHWSLTYALILNILFANSVCPDSTARI